VLTPTSEKCTRDKNKLNRSKTAPSRKQRWILAEEIWETKGLRWPGSSFGQILSSSLILFANEEGTRDQGAARLCRIVKSEAAQLIWKTRNRRVITGKEPPTRRELRHKWVHALNQRPKQDCIMTDRNLFKKLYRRVWYTWKGVLMNEKDLPKDWNTEAGVLVRM
jgi:hypothetical protein